MAIYKTTSSEQTKKIAGLLARKILVEKSDQSRTPTAVGEKKNALVLALSGDLGSGKTTFVQGFLRAAGIRKKITSPSFVLIKNYKLRIKNYRNYKKVYHFDCYRIKKSKELLDLGIKEIFNNSQNIVLIEWAEKIKKRLPQDATWLKFYHGQKINQRIIKIKLL